MTKKKLRVGVLFGGRSGEHEISLLSAASILKAVDRTKYDVVPIGISKGGQWLMGAEADRLLAGAAPSQGERGEDLSESEAEFAISAAVLRSGEPLHIPPLSSSRPRSRNLSGTVALAQPREGLGISLDVVFPVLHGTFGEDGTIQGLLELADLPYVGSGVLGSAAGMDKDVMKRLFRDAGLPQTAAVTVTRAAWRKDPTRCRKSMEAALRYPLFVKPANLGSSVGISKVHGRAELAAAMDLAAGYDRKIVVEEGVGGPGAKPRELEVAVLGNDEPEASVVGEIVPAKEFYDYQAKYQLSGPDESRSIVPARLSARQEKQIRAMAIGAFKACDCAGLARADFLLEPELDAEGRKRPKPRIFLNEINTMPGFTAISMYPRLWQASGLSYSELIGRLIDLALERHAEKRETAFSRE